MSRNRNRGLPPPTYTTWHELLASPTEPTPKADRTHQLLQMWRGLAAIEREPTPCHNDWRVCSDAVNLLETLISMGELTDPGKLLQDALTALAEAGQRHVANGAAIRLDALGIQAVRAILEDYADALEQLPHRTMVRAHRQTEQRVRAILRGHLRSHDVQVIAL